MKMKKQFVMKSQVTLKKKISYFIHSEQANLLLSIQHLTCSIDQFFVKIKEMHIQTNHLGNFFKQLYEKCKKEDILFHLCIVKVV